MGYDLYMKSAGKTVHVIRFNMADDESEAGEVLERDRRERIQELVRGIAGKNKQKRQKLMGHDSNTTHKEKPKKRTKGTGRHPTLKLQIGWLHLTRGKFRQVTARRGGGTRVFEYNRDDIQTVETVTNYAKRIFFPHGKNEVGELADMEIKLSSFSGEAIENFTGSDGQECSLQDYLKNIGVFSSEYYLYLRTSRRPPCEEPKIEQEISKEPKIEQEISGEPKIEQEISKEPKIEQEISKEPKIEQEISGESKIEQEISGEPMIEYLISEEPKIEDLISEEPKIEDLISEEPKIEDLISEEPKIEDLISEEPMIEDLISEEPKIEEEITFKVNGKMPGDICVHYTKPCYSSYTEEVSEKTCFSIDDCYNDTCLNDRETERNGYNPLHHNFKVTGITVNQITLLSRSDIKRFEYPTATHISTGVIHTPDQIMGFEESGNKQLLLGVLYKEHNCGGHFRWYRDGEEYATGTDLCIIPVTEPGEYMVRVSDKDICYECEPVRVEAQILSTEILMSNQTTLSNSLTLSTDSNVTNVPEKLDERLFVGTTARKPLNKPGENIMNVCDMKERHEYGPVSDEAQSLSTPILSPSTSSQGNLLTLSTDSNVPEIPFESLHMGPNIGEGSFGTVHKAHWLGTPVAVKTVRIRRMKLVQKTLAREVNVLSRVRHPHIILFMAYSIKNNALHIVSEYIQGSNLDDLLFGDECQQIPLLQKCHIAEKVSQAVAYLHNSSPTILHRDIKPENIILTDSLDIVKLCDLGISKLVTINSSATTYAPGMQPGTFIFQAPEILLSNTPASTKSDVWGLAGTLAELFSETPLWDLAEDGDEDAETSTVETIKSLMCQKIVPHAIQKLSLIDSFPRAVKNIVTNGANYDQERRPASIEFPTELVV